VRRIDSHPAIRWLFFCLVAVLAGCSSGPTEPSCPNDPDAIKAADRAYAAAWLANDPDRVMATLTKDAVIVPSGIPALRGPEEIRGFWWPPDSPLTTVDRFELEQKATAAEKRLAFVQGSFKLSFVYDGKDFASSGDYMSILQCQSDGSWRISHRQWSDHPPSRD
jgi:ketosteroid isomerase-like protein